MTSIDRLVRQPQKVRVSQRVGETLTELLEFDASINETHTSELQVTSHPIESGADIVDHLRLMPLTLDIDALIASNRPLEILASQGFGIKGGSPLARDVDAFEETVRWQTEKLLLTVETTLQTFENMALVRNVPTRSAGTGQVLRARLSFRQILTVETQIVDAPDTADPQNREQSDKGRQTKTEASPEVADAAGDTSSPLLDAGLALGGLF